MAAKASERRSFTDATTTVVRSDGGVVKVGVTTDQEVKIALTGRYWIERLHPGDDDGNSTHLVLVPE
jgi:hypothetical protein